MRQTHLLLALVVRSHAPGQSAAMATASIKGLMFQGDSPNWRPLLRHMDEELVGWFMWMFEVRTLDNRSLGRGCQRG